MPRLTSKIDQYIEAGYSRFHSPAHAGKLNLRDLSEVEGLDDLHYPSEVIADTQNFIAELFGAAYSYMLVGGASVGLQAACLALKKYLVAIGVDKPVLVARNIHKSVLSGLILADLNIEWLEPEWSEELGVYTRVDSSSLRFDEQVNDKYSAIILTNPSYEGFYSQIDTSAVTIPLIIDEAHGAHYHFSDALPKPALEYGADIVVQSWHKCLGSLTQTGILHLSKNSKINPEYVQDALRLLQTTSPSYLLLESIARTAEELSKKGREIISKTLDLACNVNDNAFANDDPLRFLLAVENYSGDELEAKLLLNKISCEETLRNAVLFFINRGNDFSDIQKLKITIEQIRKSQGKSSHQLITKPICGEQVMRLREAFLAKSESVNIADAVGQISAEIYAPCPPGIPLLVPGQKITESVLDFIHGKKSTINVITRSEATS